ncbi:MAG: type II toxin-antitoxin system RelE/ParE family toxin [Clostridia bacterium]|nr:type II toxin-antitoxin system RelE/ParE family toxin [Clostridia bacterium]
MVVKWAKEARKDLLDFRKSTLKTYSNVNKYISMLYNYIDTLKEFPYLGKEIFNIRNVKVRQLIFREHRIIYIIMSDIIFIISIMYTTRNIEKYIQYLKENI